MVNIRNIWWVLLINGDIKEDFMEKFTFGLFIGFESAEMGVDGLPWTKAMKWEV